MGRYSLHHRTGGHVRGHSKERYGGVLALYLGVVVNYEEYEIRHSVMALVIVR